MPQIWAQKKDSLQKQTPVGPLKPRAIMFKSAVIPGWGQAHNRQHWKIPIIYAGIGALVLFNRDQAIRYKDHRAAYYNVINPAGDQRFGPTPNYLQGVENERFLLYARDYYRNRRDISFVYVALAYGFNMLDAYIWAHLKLFDVSDDLSLAPGLHVNPYGLQPVLTTRIRF